MADDQVNVKVGASLDDAGFDEAQDRIAGLGDPIDALELKFTEFASVAATAFGTDKLIDFTEHINELGAQVEEATHQLGMSAEQVSALDDAFDVMGLGADNGARMLERLERNMSLAAGNANGPAAKAFQALGVSVTGANGQLKSADTVLAEIADRFAQTADGPTKTAIAIALMGRSGAEMIPILDRGASGLEQFAVMSQRAGATMTNDMAHGAEETKEKIGELAVAWKGFEETMTAALGPVTGVIEAVTNSIERLNNALGLTKQAQLNELMGTMDSVRTEIQSLEQEKSEAQQGLAGGIFANTEAIDKQIDAAVQRFNEAQERYQKIKDELYADSKTAPQQNMPPLPPLDTGSGATGAEQAQQQSLIEQWKEGLQERQIDEQNFFKSSQADELAYWQSKLATVQQYEEEYGLTEKQAQQLHEQVQTEIYNLDKEQAQEWLAAYKQGLADQQDALKTELAAKEISESEYYQRSIALATDWQTMMAQIYGKDSAQYRQALTQKEALDKQQAAQSQQVWTSAANTISSAFDTMLRGVLQGTQSWQVALEHLVGNLLLSWIESIAKMGIQWAAGQAEQLLASKTTDAAKVASNTTANAAITTSDATQSNSLLGQFATMIAGWLGFETQKTAVAAAGNAAGHAADIASAFSQISVDAAVAAAGAFAATASIPLVGPELAPAAASAAYAETMGWAAGLGGGLASAAGGMWTVPSDMLSLVHKQELILPASIAGPMRDFFTGGGGGGAAGGGGAPIQIVFNNNVSTMNGPSVTAHANQYAQVYAAAIANVFRRNPSLRGSY